MVFLAITPAGLQQAISLSRTSKFAIWCSSDAISEADYENMTGFNISRFAYPLDGESSEVITEALETIAEHHPGATIWVEHGKSILD